MTKPEERIIEAFLNNTCSAVEAGEVIVWFSTAEGQEYVKERLSEDERKLLIGEEWMLDHEIRSELMYERITEQISGTTSKKPAVFRNWLKIAAAILFPLLIVNAVLWMKYLKPENKAVAWQEVYVPRGEKLQVMFQDGTRVWLNSDTRLRYPQEFDGKTRNVELDGEAYFNVKKDAQRPFIVGLQQLKIRVTGTSFNVQAYKEDAFIKTTLDEGNIRLELENMGGRKRIALLPGQEASYQKEKNEVNVHPSAIGQGSGWKANKMEFKDAPLTEVVQVLQRWYNVQFEIRDKRIEKYTYTITYENEPLQAVLEGLERITPIRCSMKDSVIVIIPKY